MNGESTPSPEVARERLRRAARDVDAVVRPMRNHPWLMVGTAFGIGLLLGARPGLRRGLFAAARGLLERRARPR